MKAEMWKTIPGFPHYQVSDFGRIKSLTRYVNHWQGGKRKLKGRILKTSTHRKEKYYLISLGQDGSFLIHRLVAICFLKNTGNKPCVNHIDGNTRNNKLSNLGWCTYSENERWSHEKFGKQVWNKGTKGICKPNSGSIKKGQYAGKKHPGYKHGRYVGQKLKRMGHQIKTEIVTTSSGKRVAQYSKEVVL
jgi:hypothetical protein